MDLRILLSKPVCAQVDLLSRLSGRHYNRAVRVLHQMLDAVERMLLNAFRDTLDLTQENDSLAAVVAPASEPTTPGSFCDAEGNQLCMEFLQRYEDFKDQVRQGSLGKTAQFWLNYCDCVWTLMNFQRAVKENNLDMFIVTIRKMCSLLFSADHLHYARYLPVYYVQLCNLDRTHPGTTALLREQGFSVSRSTVPGSNTSRPDHRTDRESHCKNNWRNSWIQSEYWSLLPMVFVSSQESNICRSYTGRSGYAGQCSGWTQINPSIVDQTQ